MRETRFIKQNQEKWSEFEKTLKGEAKDADRLRDLFVQITDDLAYSRTFYPSRSVRVYLNGLAQRVFLKINREGKKPIDSLKQFWVADLPFEIYQARKTFFFTLFIFFLALGIGVLSCAMDPAFAEVILGADYVNMTEANIASNDPMQVYKQRGEFDMFLSITFNNLLVAFLAFAMGVFWGLGTLVVLVSNAIMVGCFQYFFVHHGLFWDSFLTIWIHGTLEISAIVIASAAGFSMGRGIAFPGTYTRRQAFRQSARRGTKILMGTIPLFIIAGFFEGYLTRQTETPDVVRGFFIVVCLFVVVGYFIWYPWYRQKQGLNEGRQAVYKIQASKDYVLDTDKIKSNSTIISDVFAFISKYAQSLLLSCFTAAIAYTLLVHTLIGGITAQDLLPFNFRNWLDNFFNFLLLHIAENAYWIPLAAVLMIFIVGQSVYKLMAKELGLSFSASSYMPLAVSSVLAVMSMSVMGHWSFFAIVFILPLLLLAGYGHSLHKQTDVAGFNAYFGHFQLFKGAYLSVVVLYAGIMSLGVLLLTMGNSLLARFLFDMVNWVIIADQATLNEWTVYVNTFVFAFIANFIWLLFFVAAAVLYYSLKERNEATALAAKVEEIGKDLRIRGLERE